MIFLKDKQQTAHVILSKTVKIIVTVIFSCLKYRLEIQGILKLNNVNKEYYFIARIIKIMALKFKDRTEFDNDLSTKLISCAI